MIRRSIRHSSRVLYSDLNYVNREGFVVIIVLAIPSSVSISVTSEHYYGQEIVNLETTVQCEVTPDMNLTRITMDRADAFDLLPGDHPIQNFVPGTNTTSNGCVDYPDLVCVSAGK